MSPYLEELKKFNYQELEKAEFKESSVREEIVLPLLKALGYNYTGDFKIVREKKLNHPFNMIGSKKYNISIFPDYVLEYNGQALCVVEVKSPSKSLQEEKYISQAYSYAIHREISADYYALCNGREFILYCTNDFNPILEVQLENIEQYFDMLDRIIGINNILNKEKKKIVKDLGLHLKRLSSGKVETNFYFYNLPIDIIMLVNNNTYSITKNVILDGEEYCGSFDFTYKQLLELKPYLKEKEFERLIQPFNGIGIEVRIKDVIEVGIKCELANTIYENSNEHYMPLKVCDFLAIHTI